MIFTNVLLPAPFGSHQSVDPRRNAPQARPRAKATTESNRFETSVAARITDGSVITVVLMGRISGAPADNCRTGRRVFNFSTGDHSPGPLQSFSCRQPRNA